MEITNAQEKYRADGVGDVFPGRMGGLVRRVGGRSGPRAGRRCRWPCGGRNSRPLRSAIAGWRPLNSTALQSVDPIYSATIARDARFAGKSGVGIWARSSLSRSKSTVGPRDRGYPNVEDHATAEHCDVGVSVLCRALGGLPLESVQPYRGAKCRF
jgi:hypothetical protein